MAKNSKTPVMVLQELSQKRLWAPPVYNLVAAIDGTHENKYEYEVLVQEFRALGYGTSKQIAKQDAAFKCLDLLSQKNIYIPSENPTQEFSAGIKTISPDSPFKSSGNFIVPLKEMCFENKLRDPVFTELSNTGPAHCKEFTYECTVSSVRTQATAGTKKQAKQLAAKEMLERIKHILPELAKETEFSANAISNKDEVIKRYKELSLFDVVPDKSVYLMDYHKTIPNLARERNLGYDDFIEELTTRSESALESLLTKLELTYKITTVQVKPCIMALDISTDTPFTVMSTAATQEEAINKVLDQTFDILDCYLENM